MMKLDGTTADRHGCVKTGVGLATNFDSAASYSFIFITTTGGITGFAGATWRRRRHA